MDVLYLDSSALVKLVLPEADADLMDDLWDRAQVVTSSRLADPEVRAALGAAYRARRLSTRQYREAVIAWADFWKAVLPVELTREVSTSAGLLGPAHALSGADAVHLASALGPALEPVFVTWDRRLHAAASAAGLAVVPATLD
jgi:predicted nucleic acid-binding protein